MELNVLYLIAVIFFFSGECRAQIAFKTTTDRHNNNEIDVDTTPTTSASSLLSNDNIQSTSTVDASAATTANVMLYKDSHHQFHIVPSALPVKNDSFININNNAALLSPPPYCPAQHDVAQLSLRHYDAATARRMIEEPPNGYAQFVDVELQVIFDAITNVDEVDERVSISATMAMIWNDTRLKWNNETCKINKIRVDDVTKLWRPRVLVSTYEEAEKSVELDAFIRHDGRVIATRQIRSAKILCPMNSFLFPFDQQKCTFLLYDRTPVRLIPNDVYKRPGISIAKNILQSGIGEWSMVSFEPIANGFVRRMHELTIDDEPVDPFLEKISAVVLVPCDITTLVGLLVVFRTARAQGPQMQVAAASMMSLTVFLGNLFHRLPANAESVPLLGIHYIVNFSLLGAVLILNPAQAMAGAASPTTATTAPHISTRAGLAEEKRRASKSCADAHNTTTSSSDGVQLLPSRAAGAATLCCYQEPNNKSGTVYMHDFRPPSSFFASHNNNNTNNINNHHHYHANDGHFYTTAPPATTNSCLQCALDNVGSSRASGSCLNRRNNNNRCVLSSPDATAQTSLCGMSSSLSGAANMGKKLKTEHNSTTTAQERNNNISFPVLQQQQLQQQQEEQQQLLFTSAAQQGFPQTMCIHGAAAAGRLPTMHQTTPTTACCCLTTAATKLNCLTTNAASDSVSVPANNSNTNNSSESFAAGQQRSNTMPCCEFDSSTHSQLSQFAVAASATAPAPPTSSLRPPLSLSSSSLSSHIITQQQQQNGGVTAEHLRRRRYDQQQHSSFITTDDGSSSLHPHLVHYRENEHDDDQVVRALSPMLPQIAARTAQRKNRFWYAEFLWRHITRLCTMFWQWVFPPYMSTWTKVAFAGSIMIYFGNILFCVVFWRMGRPE